MKNKKTEISKHIQGAAISFVSCWASACLDGKPGNNGKGTAVRFSRNKLRAAILMALYPNIFHLRDFSSVLDVPTGTLRIWHKQEDFLHVVQKKALELGDFIALLILGIIKGDEASMDLAREYSGFVTGNPMELAIILIDILSCLDPLTHGPLYGCRESIGEELFQMLTWRLITTIFVYGGIKKGRELMEQAIDYGFDAVLHPEKYPGMTPEARVGMGMNLKSWMLMLLGSRK
jgi:hypothetical protein